MMTAPVRSATIARNTKETHIRLTVSLDGPSDSSVCTGIGFFDHMLTHIAHHGLLGLEVEAQGDTEVDCHHTVEDVGIAFGQAVSRALGDRVGIERYGSAFVPMDEALAHVALDFSGRAFLAWGVPLPKAQVGSFDVELAQEFFRAFAANAGATVHVRLLAGENLHHILEASFKALGRAIRDAAASNPRVMGVPSTKGSL
jgi:imidazoleglycerol-phosphate dehydratase